MTWTIRDGSGADAAACREVYLDAVHNGTAPLYTAEQAAAWAPPDEPADWLEPRLETGATWIAASPSRAEGFLTVTQDGHLDLLFVRPEWRGTGLSSDLYDCMMGWAAARGLTRMTTFASHLARRFLERRGWSVVEGETLMRNGVALERWKMEVHRDI